MHWPSRLIGVAAIGFVAAAALAQPAAQSSSSGYLGSAACERCHQTEYGTWSRTLHVQMTKPIAQATIVGEFGDAHSGAVRYEAYGRAYSMEARDGKYFITVAKNGRPPEKFQVDYTLGARRFQGYLSKLPDGRIYVLPVFWHNESKRWIDWKEITPVPDDPDHDLRQIWNVTCVNCHATNLVKHYDVAANRYETTWTEMGIGCEACHGPGAAHVALMDEWAKNPSSKPAFESSASNRELSEILRIFSPKSAPSRQVFDACSYCHGNKNNIFFGFKAGDRFEDYATPFLISQPIPENDPQGEFWPDGRPSRFNRPQAIMETGCFQKGEVSCVNCHRMHGANGDHALKVQVEAKDGGHTRQSDALCTQCHTVGAGRGAGAVKPGDKTTGYGGTLVAAATIPDLQAHTHHAADSQGSRCINCHMSDVNWRLITRRLDHTFQPPNPEMTAKYGVPNACTTCHEDKAPEWAAAQMDGWYSNGDRRRAVVALADVMYRAGTGDTSALPDVARYAVDRSRGATIRASAAEFAGQLIATLNAKAPGNQAPIPGAVINSLVGAASDPEPIVRLAAMRALALVRNARTVAVAAALLGDDARAVRVSAADTLLGFGVTKLDGAPGAALAKAQGEWADSLRTFNDVSSDQATLGWLDASLGFNEEATKSLQAAVTIDPKNATAHVYLGVLSARTGNFEQALQEFKTAKALAPNYANLDRLIEEARKRATAKN